MTEDTYPLVEPTYDTRTLIDRVLYSASYVFGPYDAGTKERRDAERFLVGLTKLHRRGINRVILKRCELLEDEED